MKLGALAACAAMLIGLGNGLLSPDAATEPVPSYPSGIQSAPPAASAAPSANAGDADFYGFTAVGPAEGSKLMFPMIAGVDYADVTSRPELAASLVFPDGAFTVDLTKEDIQKLFWGPDGKPAVDNPKTDPGDFPLMLMNWAGYTITGRATYDGSGDLWELYVGGTKGEDSFALRAAPGRIPPTCIVEEGATVTDVNGVSVSGWYRSYDWDGDDVVEHICTSEFLAGGVGFRFQNVGSGGLKAGGDEADALGGAMLFNAMTVTQLCHADGFYLDDLTHNDNVPAWAEESFETLAQAQNYADYPAFSPYLPGEAPQGFGHFHGSYSYQEGDHRVLWLRWSKGYDDVEVEVRLHEEEDADYYQSLLVDASVPESYDWRLYDGAICDVVPEAYRDNFYKPAFRASDMSLEVVRARMREKDTGGQGCHFYVLHADGTVVGYSCAGVSAEYVWSLVEPTLRAGS